MIPIVPFDKKPAKTPQPASSAKNPPQPEKTLFHKRDIGLSRSEMRETLRETTYDPKVKMLRQERVILEKELFPYKKYGPNLSQKDIHDRLFLLTQEKFKAPHTADKLKIEHEINLLNKLKDQKLK